MLTSRLCRLASKSKSSASASRSLQSRLAHHRQASTTSHTPAKWLNWGSNDHGTLARGRIYDVSSKPSEVESLNALGIDELILGQNVGVGRASATGETYVWGENHGGSILTTIEGDIVRPQKLPASSLAAAGWDSVWLVNDEGLTATSLGHRSATVDLGKSQKAKVSKIFSSAFQSIFLRSDGSMTLHNDRKDVDFQTLQLDRPVIQVARGWAHFLLLDSTGSVWSVGANKHGQCGLGHTNTVITPTLLPQLKGEKIRQIASGATHSMVLTESGSVLIWGSHKDGKLGIVTDKDHTEPVEMAFFADKNIKQLAGGCDHSAATSKSGDIYTWGFGQHGALGLGELKDAPTPQKVPSFSSGPISVLDVQCGMDTTFVRVQM